MTVPSKLHSPEGPGAGRRSTRISIAIPITISGKDANGRPFKENTRTIILNKHGAKIVTVHQLALGAEVLLENRALGRTAKTTVAWLGDRPTAREPAELGIQLVEAENIWGIELPPDDWQEGPPPKEARKEASPATGPPATVTSATAHVAVPAMSATAAPPGPHPPALSPAPSPGVPIASQPPSDALAQETFKRLTSQSDQLLAGHLRKLEATLTRQAQQASAQAQATLQEASSRYEKGLEKVTKQQLDEMSQALRDYVKLAVDIRRGVVAGGGALHADCETILLKDGSQQEDVWGADWVPTDQKVTFEALINIRPRQNNRSMEIQDPAIRRRIEEIVRPLLEGV